jgi:hypothetical protein
MDSIGNKKLVTKQPVKFICEKKEKLADDSQ